MGKTTFLNAINWCLYGEEPHSSPSTSKLPLLNLDSIENAEDNFQEVMVEIWVTADNSSYILFQRRQIFRIHGNDIPIPGNAEFNVTTQDHKGNTKILEDDEAQMVVNRFVPETIKEFYFFDGERLDNYFKDTKGKNIKNQVQVLSSIYFLLNMESRLTKMNKTLNRQAGELNPDIQSKREELIMAKKDCESINQEISRVQNQIDKNANEIKEINKKLIDLPDAAELEKKRNSLVMKKKDKEKTLVEKNVEKQRFLLKSAKLIFLNPSIKNSLNTINDKKRKKEIPPTIDKSLLEKILLDCNCNVCGRQLDANSKMNVENLLKSVKLSSDVVNELHSMENPLLIYKDDYLDFMEKRKELQLNIRNYEEQLDELLKDIKNIDEKLLGHDVKQIKEWGRQRQMLEAANQTNLVKIGSLKEQLKLRSKKYSTIKAELKKLVDREKKAILIRKELLFTKKALDIVIKTKKSIMEETKNYLESETKKIFFDLLWKTATFKDVKIDKDYKINLIHEKGYDALGSASAAERELLALSFTLALHSISGFDSPILIDTPVARVSDKHRENFAEIFLKVSKNKQIILLFTPAEYSEDIYEILNDKISGKYEINLMSDENEAIIEGLT